MSSSRCQTPSSDDEVVYVGESFRESRKIKIEKKGMKLVPYTNQHLSKKTSFHNMMKLLTKLSMRRWSSLSLT